MNSINKNGCSTCAAGSENYTTFKTRVKGKMKTFYQYDYRTEGGELYSTVAPTLAKCREGRDEWLKQKNDN